MLFTSDATSVALSNINFPLLNTPSSYRIGAGVSGTILVGAGKTYTVFGEDESYTPGDFMEDDKHLRQG